MSRKKRQRFNEFKNIDNCFETKQNWQEVFNNQNPITLELACGRGEYTNGLGSIFENKNFIGVDIKGERLWQAAQVSQHLGLSNTAFLRITIDHIVQFFEPRSINEIWIIHPDPQPNNPRKRLSHKKYLEKYKLLLKENGMLYIKTDDEDLFEFSIDELAQNGFEIIEQTKDLHNSELLKLNHGIQTNFEEKALAKNKKICFLQARLIV
jgi:tRNA (guanine-N7-)-methyltransferase